MENRSHALIAGLFTVAFLMAALLAVWWFSGTRELTHTYILETRGNVIGLNLEGQVRYRGIRAGKVKSIRPDELNPDLLLIEISLGRQYRLTDRTVASLAYQGVTGLAYVLLEEGKTGKGVALDADGPVPPRIRVQPGLLEKLGEKAGDIVSQVGELALRLNRLLDERNAQNLARTLDNLASASEGMKEAPRLFADLREVVSAENRKRLQAILTHLEKTAGAAAPLTAEALSLVESLDGLARRMARMTDAVGIQAGEIGGHIEGKTLPRAETLLEDLSAATRRLDRLLDALHDAPQAIIFGPPLPTPGPGESGFVPPQSKER